MQRCIAEGLVGGEGFAVDASLIQADASDRNRVEGAAGLPPEAAGHAVEQYLAVLDDAAFGAASEVTPQFIAPSDPATRWTAAHRGPAFFAYSANYLANYLVDADNAIIVDVEATTAIRQAEILAAKRMIERSLEHFDLYPERLIGDSAYGSAEMLNWLVHDQANPEARPAPIARGPSGARGEFHLAATAQNLRKLAKLFPTASPIPA